MKSREIAALIDNELIAEARRAVMTMDYERAYQGGLVGRLADALEAAVFRERTAPTGDEREAWVDDDLYGVIDRAMQRSWTDAAEYEYAPSEITAAVRTWMDEQCFRRGAPADRGTLRRVLIQAEHDWPGNLERRLDAILKALEERGKSDAG